jgi:hypothetical protein
VEVDRGKNIGLPVGVVPANCLLLLLRHLSRRLLPDESNLDLLLDSSELGMTERRLMLTASALDVLLLEQAFVATLLSQGCDRAGTLGGRRLLEGLGGLLLGHLDLDLVIENSKVGIQNGKIRICENAWITEICAHLDPPIEIVRMK